MAPYLFVGHEMLFNVLSTDLSFGLVYLTGILGVGEPVRDFFRRRFSHSGSETEGHEEAMNPETAQGPDTAATLESGLDYRLLFEHFPLGVAIFDRKAGRIIESNARYAQILGYPREALKDLDWQALVQAEDLKACRDALARLTTGKTLQSPQSPQRVDIQRIRVSRADGTAACLKVSMSIPAIGKPGKSRVLCLVEEIPGQRPVAARASSSSTQSSLTQARTESLGQGGLGVGVSAGAADESKTVGTERSLPLNEFVVGDPRLSPADDPAWIDLGVLAQRVSNKPKDVRKLALKFIESAVAGVSEIEAAEKLHDAPALAALAHRIKAPARTVGAERFATHCQTLEGITSGQLDWIQAHAIVADLRYLLSEIRMRVDCCLQKFPGNVDAASVSSPALTSSLRVLMVDDEVFHFEFVQNILRQFGIHSLHHARDGVEGLSLYQTLTDRPDVLICDLNMPRMDGVEFLRHIAEQDFQGGVILLSGAQGSVLKIVAQLMREHGLDLLGVFEKPVSAEALSSALAKVGRHKRRPTGMASPISALTAEALREGLANDRIEVYYQPKVCIHTREVLGAECLARWRHPEHGILGPNTFIPVAEEYGLIDEITLAILKKSTLQLGQWQSEGHGLTLSVNVSMDNLRHLQLPETFDRITREAGVDPRNVVLELTESRLMGDHTTSLDIIARLRLKGFDLSIDDFGTGFSTLDSLKRLPFTELKVDRAFVNGAAHDSSAHAILSSSVHLARTFQLQVVAEGVETQEDWDVVARAGCDIVQGYFVAKPMPASDFTAWKTTWENGIGK